MTVHQAIETFRNYAPQEKIDFLVQNLVRVFALSYEFAVSSAQCRWRACETVSWLTSDVVWCRFHLVRL
jgi:hypothetical protein